MMYTYMHTHQLSCADLFLSSSAPAGKPGWQWEKGMPEESASPWTRRSATTLTGLHRSWRSTNFSPLGKCISFLAVGWMNILTPASTGQSPTKHVLRSSMPDSMGFGTRVTTNKSSDSKTRWASGNRMLAEAFTQKGRKFGTKRRFFPR